MNKELTREERTDALGGMGCKRKRVEDASLPKAKAITLTTSNCPACCMVISCVRPMPTPRSCRSMPRRHWRWTA